MHLRGENSHCWHNDAHGNPFGKNGKCRSKQASVASVFHFSFLNGVRAQVLYNGKNVETNEKQPFILFPKVHDIWQTSSPIIFSITLLCQSDHGKCWGGQASGLSSRILCLTKLARDLLQGNTIHPVVHHDSPPRS